MADTGAGAGAGAGASPAEAAAERAAPSASHALLSQHISVIRPRLLLGDVLGSGNKSALEEHGVTHVCVVGKLLRRRFKASFTYYKVDAHDIPEFSMLPHLRGALKFISDAVLAGGTVFVHCRAGVSRSATVVLAYLMAQDGMSPAEALKEVQAARSVVNPNMGFRAQLERLHELLLECGGDLDAAADRIDEEAADDTAIKAKRLRDAAAMVTRFRKAGLPDTAIEHRFGLLCVSRGEVEAYMKAEAAKADVSSADGSEQTTVPRP